MSKNDTTTIMNSSIFKTFENDLDGATNKIGIFNKTFESIGQDRKTGHGILTSVLGGNSITSNDIASIKAMDIAMKSGSTYTQAWTKNMTECTVAAKQQAKQCIVNKGSLIELANGMKATSVSAKVATVGLKALSIAGNMIAFMAIVKGIQLAATAIDNIAHASEKCKERVDNLISSFNSALDSANSNANKIEELASKYETLSKGVNLLGENVSLTTEEYTEYNNIVNDIADMFPTLISGYTDEGNAILSLKGNVEELRNTYKEAQQEAYNMLIVSGQDSDGNDIIKNFDNTVFGEESPLSKSSSVIDGKAGAKDAIDIITRLTGALTPDEFRDTYDKLYEEYENVWNSDKIKNALKSSGFKELTSFPKWSKITTEDLANVKQSAQVTIQTYNSEIDSALSSVQALANAYLMTNDDYSFLDQQSKTIASQIVNTINEEIASGFNDKVDVGAYVQSILDIIKNNPDTKDAMQGLFTTDLSELSPDNAKEIVDKYIKKIAEVLGEDALELKIRLGFDNTDDLATKYENAIKSTQDKFGSDETEFFTKNSINTDEEIDNWLECANAANSAADAEQRYLSIGKDDKTTILSTSDTISDLKDLEDQFSSLDAVIASLVNGDKIDLSELDSLGDSLKELDGANLDVINDSLEQLSNATSVDEAQSAMNSLCDEYIRCSAILDGLTEDNAELIASRLKSIGVGNAEQIVEEQLAINKFKTKLETEGLTNATLAEMQALMEEQGYVDATQQAMYRLLISKLDVNNMQINTTGDIQNLINLANAAGASYAQLMALQKLLALMGDGSVYSDSATNADTQHKEQRNTQGYKDSSTTSVKDYVQQEAQNIADQMKNAWTNLNASDYVAGSQYTGGDATQKAKEGSGSPKETAEKVKEAFYEVFDWMERKINFLERIAKKAIDRVVDSLQYASDGKYVDSTFKKINEQMAQNAKMIKRYQKSANDVGLSSEWKKLVEEGGDIDYSEITDEQLSKDIKAYEDWYKKSLDCKEANEALRESIKDVADALANAPLDKAAEKLEKYESATTLLDAKVENAVSAKDKNKLINSKAKNITSTLSADKRSYDESASNVSKYSKKITGQKVVSGATKKQKDKYSDLMKKVKTFAKSGKKIDDKTLNAIYDYCASVKSYAWYENCVAYNASIDAKSSAKETYDLYKETAKSDKAELLKEKFDNVSNEYQNKIGLIEHSMQDVESQKAIVEAKGQMLDSGYYNKQKEINSQQLEQYKAEKSSLESLLPTIQEGTDDWYDAKSQIQDCADAISECEKNTLEYNNAINELNVELFEKVADQINRITSEQEFLAKLMSHEKQFDDNGSLTESGLATLGTYTTSYYASIEKANRDKAELDKLKQMLIRNDLGTFNSTDQLKERIDELYTTWQNDISETYTSQENIFNMMSQKFDAELDALKEMIDARKEALSVEKELYEYQNQIAEKTQSITTLQKQMAAYKGDTSQESQAKLQKLQVSLQDAQKDLKDTEYQKYLSDQEDMLDKLYTDYSETIQKRLEDFQEVVQSGLNTANENSAGILGILNKVSGENGYNMQYNSNGQTTLQGYVSQITNAITSIKSPTLPDGANNNAESAVSGTTQPNWATTDIKNNSDFTDKGGFFDNPTAIKAEKYIKAHLNKAENKKSEYSDLNQGFYTAHSGKILSSDELRELANIVGVTYDNANKSGNLYKKLKELDIAGFSKGGIARELQGKIRQNGDSLLASVNPNETILTQDFTKILPDAVDVMSRFIEVKSYDYSNQMISKIPQSSVGDVQFNFELSGCQNATDVLEEIKSNRKVQKAIQAITIDQMLGKSRLSVYSIK